VALDGQFSHSTNLYTCSSQAHVNALAPGQDATQGCASSMPSNGVRVNEHMGGVDLFDTLISVYKVDHKNQMVGLIYYCVLNVAVVKYWILSKRHFKHYGIPLQEQLNFWILLKSISQALANVYKQPQLLQRPNN